MVWGGRGEPFTIQGWFAFGLNLLMLLLGLTFIHVILQFQKAETLNCSIKRSSLGCPSLAPLLQFKFQLQPAAVSQPQVGWILMPPNPFILWSLRLKAESRARTNSGSESNAGAVRKEGGLVLHEIGHHCVRRFPGPDMWPPKTDRGPDSCRAAV